MANADAPFGFRPINRDGSPYNGATFRAVFASGDGTATFIGDAVKLAGTSIEGYPTIAQAAAGDPVLGVVTAFEANPSSLGDQYRKVLLWVTSTGRQALSASAKSPPLMTVTLRFNVMTIAPLPPLRMLDSMLTLLLVVVIPPMAYRLWSLTPIALASRLSHLIYRL
jgi:hypothetical protein